MKTYLTNSIIVLGILLFNQNIFSQTTAIPDVNFEQALIDKGYDSGTPDGVVLTANIANLKTLGVGYKNISDLTGIEDFTSLIDLGCAGNQITSLDLSKNIHLTSLECYESQITSLDISQNKNLTFLFCGGNPITSLDISLLASLSTLICDRNQLTKLDVTNNDSLRSLSCSENSISNLVLSNNPLLTGLWCSDNQINNLDLSNNNHIIDINCNNNKINSLNISNCHDLIYLECVDNNLTNLVIKNNYILRYLFCDNNQLTSLNASFNNSLEEIYCSGNSLTCLNAKNDSPFLFINALNNPNLTCIETNNVQKAEAMSYIDPNTYFSLECPCSLGDESFESTNEISIYPNPIKNKVNIEFNAVSDISLSIYNTSGKLLFKKENINSPTHHFEFSQPAGVYIMEVNSKEVTRKFKLIKE